MTLDDAIATLYTREINCGCETFWDGGMKVWIGDMMNGHDVQRSATPQGHPCCLREPTGQPKSATWLYRRFCD
jgi:hypothetical protein